MEEKKYAYWLCSLPGIGNKAIGRLLEVCGGTAEAVYLADRKLWETVLRKRQLEQAIELTSRWKPEEEYEKLGRQGIAFWHIGESAYPHRLREIPDAPYGIYVKGKLPLEEVPTVAVIGARDCSEYGKWVAAELGRCLGSKGIQVISGMARGIDGISQAAALETGGSSYGVLGCGVDICYPAQNRKLYEELIRSGGVLSPYPPGTLPKQQHFPPRNRIVSGLADVVVVIEARSKSGTLITVDMALEQGKEVYVVPGRITDKLSDGCNRLIRQGAGVVLSPEDFFEEICELWQGQGKVLLPSGGECSEQGEGRLSPELRRVYEVLDLYPGSVGQIAEKMGPQYSLLQINTALLQLCMEGCAKQLSPGFFCRSGEQSSILLEGNQL